LGSIVTLVEKESRILPEWDADASAHLLQSLREAGVNVVLGEEVNVEQIPRNPGGTLQMEVGGLTIDPDLLLMGCTRRAKGEISRAHWAYKYPTRLRKKAANASFSSFGGLCTSDSQRCKV
jgi:pyruvate/2-oxoglutarate dehydrogenase complex dihydrolipoamide dehydrogenase (E3) component